VRTTRSRSNGGATSGPFAATTGLGFVGFSLPLLKLELGMGVGRGPGTTHLGMPNMMLDRLTLITQIPAGRL
jgi:hypothetical protein